ncbi:MAG: YebC/PmpR family DNA-binding transcriptional regulator [Candidatus Paceibacterota bacterium]
MSGHNKWSKIKHKKAATDEKKSKEFSRLAQLISIESKKVGGDENSPALRLAIEKARTANMPKGNIARAIAKGKSGEADNLEQVVYEAYGPGSVALIIEGYTDNRNRTGGEVRHALTKQGFALAEQGAASWAFEKAGDGWRPTTTMGITPEDKEKLDVLVDVLLELEDVEDVFTNANE